MNSQSNIYQFALEAIANKGLDLNPALILSALTSPLQFKEFEPVFHNFCEILSNEGESEDIQLVIFALCSGLKKEYAPKAWSQIFDIWVANNEEEMGILLEQMIKYECLIMLLPKDSLCDMVKEFTHDSDVKEILALIETYIVDKEEDDFDYLNQIDREEEALEQLCD